MNPVVSSIEWNSIKVNAFIIAAESSSQFNQLIVTSNAIFDSADTKRLVRNAFSVTQNASTVHMIKSDERPTRNESTHRRRPLFASSKNEKLPLEPKVYRCTNRHSLDCMNRTDIFRKKILREFQTSLNEEITDSSNYYNVTYANPDEMSKKYQSTSMLLDAKVRVLTKNDPPFDKNKIGRLFPARRIFGRCFATSPKTCAIVSSAGSLFQSGMGQFIGWYMINIPRLNFSLLTNIWIEMLLLQPHWSCLQ